jgi:uncharacterized protein (DUF885 family)
MTLSPLRALLLGLVVSAAAPVLAQAQTARPAAPVTAAAPAAGAADGQLRAIYEATSKWRQAESGHVDIPGEHGLNGPHIPHVDAATQARQLAYFRNVIAQLDRVPVAQLSPEERINYEVFRTQIEEEVTDGTYKLYEAPFNADTFFWTGMEERDPFRTADQYRRYLARMAEVPQFFDENIANMRAGLKRGFTVPKVATLGRDKSIEPYLQPGADNPYFAALARMPDNIPQAEQAQLRAQAEAVIRTSIVPAYTRLLAFMRTEYIPHARENIAAESLPDGKAYYAAMIRKFTTTDLTADQIHAIGLKEVARIQAEMETTMRRAGFKGTLAQFIVFLRTDPQFYAKTPHELLADAAYVAKKSDYKLKDVVGYLPRFRHGILPVPPALAPIYTGGRGGLEACLMNTYDLPSRPLYTLPALVLHECTPGHSFQAALSLEAPARPDFRKYAYFSGYGEGWALYMEWLGNKSGIYETPYEEFGQLTYEMWRAARLVIDTGMHHDGWTRAQALDYLRSHTALSEHEITTEVDRYIAWPGQALAYKLGELQIRRERAEAEAKLGPKFDQRIFHDVILQLGAVPLPTLDRAVQEYIAAGGVNPHPWPGADAQASGQ